ncbi:MAG: hypothetical protein DWQ37_07190 [Planctomycetota bacterium]|nr:MAG: hypothetical protein DWQ37_07190 [Planctomycetota bacterium]
MKRDQAIRTAVFVALVALAVAVRLVSETPNFNAVTAAALFAGFYFRSRLTAVCVPLLAMSISDVFLGGYGMAMMAAVYVSLFVPIAWRSVLRRGLSPLSVGSGAVSSSLVHYGLSNLAVWYFWYPHNWEGLARCYAVAVPFLANSLASNVLFAAGFFGLYAAVTQLGAKPTTQLVPEAA